MAEPRAPDEFEADRRRVAFTEVMAGNVTFGETDHRRGARAGRRRGEQLAFRLTIAVSDIDRFVTDPTLEASANGHVYGSAVAGRHVVERGVFNLFVDRDGPRDKRMLYRLWFHDGAGHPLTLYGFKIVHDHPGPDLWTDTTTLYTRLLRGHVEPGGERAAEVVASGILRITPTAFARQLTTFRMTGPTWAARLGALLAFGRLFVGRLWRVYGGASPARTA